MKRYLVTGVAGFIGANVAAALLRAGHEVVGVDNINDYYDPLLKHYRLRPLLAESIFHLSKRIWLMRLPRKRCLQTDPFMW